jgi:choice-of-anchor C domain-containing protein
LVNGSYETVTGTAIDGWVIGGNVDHIGDFWAAQDGNQSVDLNGTVVGSLTQGVSLMSGQLYNLTFYLSGNPDGPPNPKTLDVSVDGFSSSVFMVNPVNRLAMNWAPFSFNFVASGTGMFDLVFQSTSQGGGGVGGCPSGGNCFGPALDNVSITAIPEPEIYAMMAAGLGLMGFVGRRRKLKIATA